MPDPMQKFFDATPESVGHARAFAATTLASWGLAEHIANVRVCVSEMTSNALVHGSLTGDGFLLKLTTDEDFLHIEVHDRSELRPHLRKPTDNQVSGRGLLIVEEISDGWGVEERGPLGKVVWSRFKAAPPTGEAAPC